MIGQIEHKLRRTAQKTAIGAVGSILILVGVGFLTAAAWMGLSLIADSLVAASVIGGAYTGVGLIVLGVSSARSKREAYVPPQKREVHGAEALTGLAGAFMEGMSAGMAARDGYDAGRTH